MALQLLEHTKKAGEKIYRYYSIAEPYREDGKNKKRVLAHLGALEADQVKRIRTALRIQNDPGAEVFASSDIACTQTWQYLDLAVFHAIWKQLGISSCLHPGEGDVEIGKLLEILVLNRIAAPTSKLGVTRWYPSTALAQMTGVLPASISESRMYRCLPGIASQQEVIEQYLFKNIVRPKDPKMSSLYFYDLTTSYFEGDCAENAAQSAHSKDHRPDCLQVVLGLLINEQGLPFSWDVFKGNQGEAPTLIMQLKKFKKRFGIENALLVFDRGFLSHDNLHAVEKAGYHYLTGLRAPQIETLLLGQPQKWLNAIHSENAETIVSEQKKWKRFDETGFYSELGIVNERKTVLLFDVSRFKLAVATRQNRLDAFRAWVQTHNEWLASFKKDAFKSAIENDVNTEIGKRKLEGFVSFELHEYTTENETLRVRKNDPRPGSRYMSRVKSFQIVIRENNRSELDGVFALITSPESPLDAEQMVIAYREKYLIESAFREMKSILKLRPWFVYKEEHIRAHYTICVLAYLLERIIDLGLEKKGLKLEGWTLGSFKEELKKYRLVEFALGEKHQRQVLQKTPDELVLVLKKLGLGACLKPPQPLPP
jgi:transposase